MTITREIVDREELKLVLGLARQFVEQWTSAEVAAAYRAGECSIPPMPVLVGLGREWKFHLSSVRAWLLENFQTGGATARVKPAGKPSGKGGRK